MERKNRAKNTMVSLYSADGKLIRRWEGNLAVTTMEPGEVTVVDEDGNNKVIKGGIVVVEEVDP